MRCLELGVWLKKRDQAKVVFVLLEATGQQRGFGEVQKCLKIHQRSHPVQVLAVWEQ